MAGQTTVTSRVYEAFLRCETKAYLLSVGATGLSSEFQEWRATERNEYKSSVFERLRATLRPDEYLVGTPSLESIRDGVYKFIFDPLISARGIEAQIHALQRAPLDRNASKVAYLPLRVVSKESLDITDKLLLAFDAIAVSKCIGTGARSGKVIYGAKFTATTISLPKIIKRTEHTLHKIAARQNLAAPPPLILNRHCPVCEFQQRCRQVAVEKDDLSLLANMKIPQRSQLAGRGIFTVNQLSYTYRPRRRAVREGNKLPKHDSALKALAIRKKQLHVIGSPAFTIPQGAVYCDVESVPDRKFYYLLGLRYRFRNRDVQRSFWADDPSEEHKLWAEYLRALAEMDAPRLIHYGNHEAVFLRRMKARYCRTGNENAMVDALLSSAINLLSYTYAQIYFPTYSNGLKEIARHIGFEWSAPAASGLTSLVWRGKWEATNSATLKQKLLTYNSEDCEALQKVAEHLAIVCAEPASLASKAVHVDANGIERDHRRRFGNLHYALPDFKQINEAAYWDYQRSKVYARTNNRIRSLSGPGSRTRTRRCLRVTKVIQIRGSKPETCTRCGSRQVYNIAYISGISFDLRFFSYGMRRWVTRLAVTRFVCWRCRFRHDVMPEHKRYGRGLTSYVMYQIIELRISQRAVIRALDALFNLQISPASMSQIKSASAASYAPTYKNILKRIAQSNAVYVDETTVRLRAGIGYVWTFNTLEDVAYVYSESREGSILENVLGDFKGVLVSDFYSAYDSVDCPQQKLPNSFDERHQR